LIIRSHPRNFAEIQSIIEELDRPIPQVLIKVLVAEVTHDQTNEHGAEWSILNDAETANLFTIFGLLGPGAGGLIFTLAENNLEVTLRALEARGKLDVLSRPYILVAETQEASITVGQEVPFIR